MDVKLIKEKEADGSSSYLAVGSEIKTCPWTKPGHFCGTWCALFRIISTNDKTEYHLGCSSVVYTQK